MKAAGYSLDEIWRMTPRQTAAFLFLARRRQRRDMANTLWINAMAARAEPKEIAKRLRELSED